MTKSLHIGYFYPNLLNLYGDNGNVEILAFRARKRNIETVIHRIDLSTDINSPEYAPINLIFMGGGPDSSQKQMYDDLVKNKSTYLKEYINAGKVGLYVCGAYQLLGNYYKSSDGDVLNGLGIFDLYTEHFGPSKPRCIGNTLAKLNTDISNDTVYVASDFGDEIVGFENHGGRTYLGNELKPLATVIKAHGNNSEDGTEGALYKNSLGTYFHGPFLSRNPHIADYLIFKALNMSKDQIVQLPQIDDTLTLTAHTASKNLKQ